jgi:aspartyl/asparaginyl beta-hydroxylase (cupin superfamily)
MLLDTPYKDLCDYDVTDIIKSVEKLSLEEWNKWDFRQKIFNKPHGDTLSFPFIWSRPGTTIYLEKFNLDHKLWILVKPIIVHLEELLNGACVTALFANLKPGGIISPHSDMGYKLTSSHRCHIPIILPEGVEFKVRGETIPFQINKVYEISNVDLHSVINNSDENRVHLIIDILPIDA